MKITQNLNYEVSSLIGKNKIEKTSLKNYESYRFKCKTNDFHQLKIEITQKIKTKEEINKVRENPLEMIPNEYYIQNKNMLKESTLPNPHKTKSLQVVSFHKPTSYEVPIDGNWKKGHAWIMVGGRIIFQYFFIHKYSIIRLWVDADFGLNVKTIDQVKAKYEFYKYKIWQFVQRFSLN